MLSSRPRSTEDALHASQRVTMSLLGTSRLGVYIAAIVGLSLPLVRVS